MKLIRVSLLLVAFAASIAVQRTVSAQAPGADALVAAYGFNEGTGTTATDASGNLLTGAITGATWSATGQYGGALSFDGSGDWVTINDASSLDLSTDDPGLGISHRPERLASGRAQRNTRWACLCPLCP